jgi:alcohol dehydrogenase (NADP+)
MDFIINTADMTHEFNMKDYMSMLNIGGHFHQVGLPDEPLPQMMAQDFVSNMAAISASHIGCRPEALAMLKLAADKNLHPMIETIPISEKGCSEAVQRVKKNDVRYRFTLTDYDEAFGSR